MKKLKIIIGFLITLSSLLQADQYILVMSKDDEVCQYMEELYNTDLRKKGKVILEDHEEYNAIKWDENISIYALDGSLVSGWYAPAKYSIYDINNDGQDEMVISDTGNISGRLYDVLDYFPKSLVANKNHLTADRYANRLGRVFGNDGVSLTQLPPLNFKNKGKYYHVTLEYFKYIRTFKYKSTFYINIFGIFAQEKPLSSLNKTNIAIVRKFTPENSMQDICYFIKAFTLKGEKQ